jgi:DNA-binding PadR family transcriptional regulator
MIAGTVSLRYLILGLLAQRPMSGYDIKRFFKGLAWLIGSPSSGSLYPILRALLQQELATVHVIPGVDRPPRKIYSITDAGSQALQVWLDQPAAANAPLKAFVMRLLLADGLAPALLAAHLRQRRKQVAAHLASLQGTAAAGGGQQLAVDYGLALATAELVWLDGVLGELPEQSPPEREERIDGVTVPG